MGNSHDNEQVAAGHRWTIVGYDVLATLCGLCGALLLTGDRPLAPTFGSLKAAILLLVLARVTGVVITRSWSLAAWDKLRVVPLFLAMVGVSLVFALVFPVLPQSAYVLELFLTTTFMLMVRLAMRSFATPRRALNIAVAFAGLIITLPVWIIIAIAIKLTSRGPIFYKQERVGVDLRSTGALPGDPRRKHDLGGRPFMMVKFRTMTVDAENSTGAVWCAERDSRVTAVGRFLRHTRLDELPQFINVLKGDMNVVGPRPERPAIFAELRRRIPNYSARQRTPPGITGYAQVNLEYDSSIEDVIAKLQYDLEYVSQQSVAADLAVMIRTLPVMLLRSKMLSRGGALLRTSPELVPDASPTKGGAPSAGRAADTR